MARAKTKRRTASRVAIYSAVLVGLYSTVAANAGECSLRQVVSLHVEQGPQGLFLVPASVNGKQILMLLDTGATRGVLDTVLVNQLGLPASKLSSAQPVFDIPNRPLRGFVTFPGQQYYLANGATLDQFTIVPSFDLGKAHKANITFMLAGINDTNGSPLKGILGNDLLRNYDVEIDPRGALVNLFDQNHCEGKVVYWASAYSDIPIRVTADGQIAFEMSLDGHDVDTVLDTGAANTTLSLQIARQVFGIDTAAPGVEHVSGDGKDAVYRTRFKSLVAGGIAVNAPQIMLVRDALADRLREDAMNSHRLMPELTRTPELILGMDVLRNLHIYIAYKESKLYITGADAGAASAPNPLTQPSPSATH